MVSTSAGQLNIGFRKETSGQESILVIMDVAMNRCQCRHRLCHVQRVLFPVSLDRSDTL